MAQVVTLQSIKAEARRAYGALWAKAKSLGRDVKLYCHWTAGHWWQLFDDYHICIDADGTVYQMKNFDVVTAATYMRNSGSISIALCCAYGAQSENDLGPYPPTEKQLNALAQVICVLADALDLTIDIQRVMTHAEAAANRDGLYPHDNYGPGSGDPDTRWDLWVCHEGEVPWSGGDTIRGNANFYRAQGLLNDF